MTNKKYFMGGGGNQKWGGYSTPSTPSTPTGGTKTNTGGSIGGDIGGTSDFKGNKGDKRGGAKGEPKEKREPSGQKREPKGELSDKDKAKKEFAERQRNTPEAKAARERQAALKAMTPQQRADHFASAKMFDRMLSREAKAWTKKGGQLGSDPKWTAKLAELKKAWAKGGQKKWMGQNAKTATSIRDKAQREEIYKAGKRGEKRPVFKNKPIKGTKQAKEKKTKLKAEMKPKTWKQNRAKGHGAIKDFKIHTPLSKGKK